MKRKIIMSLGALVVGLTGGLAVCGDEFFEPDDTTGTTVSNEPGIEEPSPTERQTRTLALSLLRQPGAARPAYAAVRAGLDGNWRRLDLDSIPEMEVGLGIHDEYTLLLVCEGFGEKAGRRIVQTVVLEGTHHELPSPRIGCSLANPEADTVQLAGAVRGTGGQDVTIEFGTRRIDVANEKRADGVLFATKAPPGKTTFAATLGGGAKAVTATGPIVDVTAPVTNVEIDLADARSLGRHAYDLSADGTSVFTGGQAFLWAHGLTRLDAGPLQGSPLLEEDQLSVRRTQSAKDIVDLRMQFRSTVAWSGTTVPQNAFVRVLRRADDATAVVVPDLSRLKASSARLDDTGFEVAWEITNWSILGHDTTGDPTIFLPVAYVAQARYATPSSERQMDVVVTANRVIGMNPVYHTPRLVGLPGWNDDHNFVPPQGMELTAGNLTAQAREGGNWVAADFSQAIAAYLDSRTPSASGGMSPAVMAGSDAVTIVVGGQSVDLVDERTDLSAVFKRQCVAAAPCVDAIRKDAMGIADCPDIEIYRDCEVAADPEVAVGPHRYAQDLRAEIAMRYAAGEFADEADALTVERAMDRVQTDLVKQDDGPADERSWITDNLQIYYHPDPVAPGSARIWYGTYWLGRLVQITAVNEPRLSN